MGCAIYVQMLTYQKMKWKVQDTHNKISLHRIVKSFQSCCSLSWSFSSTFLQSPTTSRFQSSNTPAEPCLYHPCYSYTTPTHHQSLAIHPVLHRSGLLAHLEGWNKGAPDSGFVHDTGSHAWTRSSCQGHVIVRNRRRSTFRLHQLQ